VRRAAAVNHETQIEPGQAVTQLVRRARSHNFYKYLVAAIAFAVVIVIVGDTIDHHLEELETWIEQLGPWGVLAFVGIFVVAASLFVPDTLLSILAGALFGMRLGLTAVVAGMTIASSLQYLLARSLLRPVIERALGRRPSLAAVRNSVLHDELKLQLLLRLTPLNPATISYMLGASGVAFPRFILASIALVPHLTAEVYLGYAGKHVAHMAGRSTPGNYVHDAIILGGLVMTVAVVIFVSRIAQKALMTRVEQTDGSA